MEGLTEGSKRFYRAFMLLGGIAMAHPQIGTIPWGQGWCVENGARTHI